VFAFILRKREGPSPLPTFTPNKERRWEKGVTLMTSESASCTYLQVRIICDIWRRGGGADGLFFFGLVSFLMHLGASAHHVALSRSGAY